MRITYYKTSSGREPAREYIDGLQKAALEIVLKDLTLIRELGLNAPIVTRHLKEKLWEIKTGSGRQQRIFYVIITGPEMILLHACKKQKKGSQQEDVELAYKRMKEVLQ
jgi:phage-related protein